MNTFPIQLHNIDGALVPINAIATTNSFFVRAIQRFSIRLVGEPVGGTNQIYSVKRRDVPTGTDQAGLFDIVAAVEFSNLANFAYTLFLESDAKIGVTGIDGIEKFYQIAYRPANVLTEEQGHYADLLANNRLPTFEELQPAYIGANEADLVKRMLLDFKALLRHKGKKAGVEKFLNFIGFTPDSITVWDEWETPSGTLTLEPDTAQDIKTGNYHVLFDNWAVDSQTPWTEKNMPRRLSTVTDMDAFFAKLWYAVVLANVYFTLPEQDINFFGVTDSANGMKFLSVVGVPYMMHEQAVNNFSKGCRVQLYEQLNVAGDRRLLVFNNVQKQSGVDKSSVKTYGPKLNGTVELYEVGREIWDDEQVLDDMDFTQISTTFGNILHLVVSGPVGCFWQYEVANVANPLSVLKGADRVAFGASPDETVIVTTVNGRYSVTIWIWDGWNNREKYAYEYVLNNVSTRLAVETFNSSKVYGEIEYLPGVYNAKVDNSGQNTDSSSTAELLVRGADNTEISLLLGHDAATTGLRKFLLSAAPLSIMVRGVQATPLRMKVNGLIFEVGPFNSPGVAIPLTYTVGDISQLLLNDGGPLTNNAGDHMTLGDGTIPGMSSNLYVQVWYPNGVEPEYRPLPNDTQPSVNKGLVGDIDLDVESTWEISQFGESSNYVLPLGSVPADLGQYYGVDTQGLVLSYLFSATRHETPEINKNFAVDLATQTIPVDFMDCWLDVRAVRLPDGFSPKLRKVNELTLLEELIDIGETGRYGAVPNKLFVTVMDIVENQGSPDVVTPWLFISTVEPGIDITMDLFDVVLLSASTGEVRSIYGYGEDDPITPVMVGRVPVNYDFPLFFRVSSLRPDVVPHPPIPNTGSWSDYPVIRSIYPRLAKLNQDASFLLSLGDLFVCRFDSRYVSNCKDIKWTVINEFTGKTMLESGEFMLKYRVSENAIYTVVLEFKAGVNGSFDAHRVESRSLVSSFWANA